MGTGYGTGAGGGRGEGGEQGAAEVTSIGVLIPNALERSKTPLKGL